MLEWNLIYVGSSDCPQYDQVVDSVSVGPIPAGNHEFNFDSENQVDPSRIQEGHLLGPTVIILNALYNDQEFVRVGYYVNIFYEDQEMNENPPEVVDFSKLRRGFLGHIFLRTKIRKISHFLFPVKIFLPLRTRNPLHRAPSDSIQN